jgi:hypothetical protein
MTITFRAALYAPSGDLVKTFLAYPVEDPPRPEPVADLIALAAESGGGEHTAGDILIWMDRDAWTPSRIEQAQPDATRTFGPGTPPVPRYRWRRGAGQSVILSRQGLART